MEEHKMSKVSIAELASVLMEKHGLKRTEAELFIRQFVGVINDGLKSDKSVKVKGLGTFKVQAVSARKSVDVNTGEAIVIEGRDKITFTADTVMRDLVNAPFAQFETVIVNDGVDFSEIDAKHEIDNVETQESTPVADVKPKLVEEPTTAPVVESMPVVDQTPVVKPTEESVSIIEEKLDSTVEEKPESIMIDTQTEVESQPQFIAEDTPPVVVEDDSVNAKEITSVNVEETTSKEADETTNDDVDEKAKSYKNTIIILASSLAFVVVLAIVGFFYMFSQLEKRDNRIEHLEAQTANMVDRMMKTHIPMSAKAEQKITPKPTKAETEVNIITENEKKIEAAEKADKLKEEKVKEKKVVEEKKPTTISAPSAYDNDPRVRTGAYVITGIANTITVKTGQTMSSLSKTYLGPGMECYLEAVNGGNRELKAGEKIKIPALKTKKSLKK